MKRKSGFTLIELAIVLVIVGIVLSMGLDIGTEMTDRANRSKTKSILNNIESALVAYKRTHGSIPCPARRDLSINDANFGTATDCTTTPVAGTADVNSESPEVTSTKEIRIGAVPVKALNLPSDHMFDAWNNRITYAAIRDLTTSAGYVAYTEAADTDTSGSADTTGIIKVKNSSGVQVTNADSKIIVPYVLLSHGRDMRGSYNKSGNTNALDCASAGASPEAENCDDDSSFIDEQMFDIDGDANYYDDIIRWKTKDKLDQDSSEAIVTTSGLPSCSEGEILKVVSGSWACSDDYLITGEVVYSQSSASGTSATTNISLASYTDAKFVNVKAVCYAGSGSSGASVIYTIKDGGGATLISTYVCYAYGQYYVNNFASAMLPIPVGAATVTVTKTAVSGNAAAWSLYLIE